MALSADQVTAAKAVAKEYLEYSTYILCLSLGVDPNGVSSDYTIPVASDDPLYNAHNCLKIQLAAFGAL